MIGIFKSKSIKIKLQLLFIFIKIITKKFLLWSLFQIPFFIDIIRMMTDCTN